MGVKVIQPGLLTTVQDLGRTGYQKMGVSVSGAVDATALRLANLLVGNDPHEAGLEMTLNGSTLLFEEDTLIAICGAPWQPMIQGKPVGLWKPIFVKKGAELTFSNSSSGARIYIAFSGGVDVPIKMGSKSTFLKAGIGGFEGRPLKKEDVLLLGKPSKMLPPFTKKLDSFKTKHRYFIEANWSVSHSILPKYSQNPTVRVILSPEFERFKASSQANFFNDAYRVTPQSDRMGYRLEGPQLELKQAQTRISEPIQMGTIQVPSSGQPILLLSDRQTIGGYPVIGHVATVDLSLVAQTKPGDSINFKQTTLEDAQQAFIDFEKEIHLLTKQINQKRFI